MNFVLSETDLCRVIMGFLRSRGCYETLGSLLLESNVCEFDYAEEILYLQKITLQGRWDEVIGFMKPIKEQVEEISARIDFIIKRQKFLETLSWLGGGGDRIAFPPFKPSHSDANYSEADQEASDMEITLDLLNSIKDLCTIQEFNSLCQLLTLESLNDHPDFETWTVTQGRYECFTSLRSLILKHYPSLCLEETIPGDKMYNDALVNIISMGLMFQQGRIGKLRDFGSNALVPAALSERLGYFAPCGLTTEQLDRIGEVQATVYLHPPIPYLKRFDQKKPFEKGIQLSRPSTRETKEEPSIVKERNQRQLQREQEQHFDQLTRNTPRVEQIPGDPIWVDHAQSKELEDTCSTHPMTRPNSASTLGTRPGSSRMEADVTVPRHREPFHEIHYAPQPPVQPMSQERPSFREAQKDLRSPSRIAVSDVPGSKAEPSPHKINDTFSAKSEASPKKTKQPKPTPVAWVVGGEEVDPEQPSITKRQMPLALRRKMEGEPYQAPDSPESRVKTPQKQRIEEKRQVSEEEEGQPNSSRGRASRLAQPKAGIKAHQQTEKHQDGTHSRGHSSGRNSPERKHGGQQDKSYERPREHFSKEVDTSPTPSPPRSRQAENRSLIDQTTDDSYISRPGSSRVNSFPNIKETVIKEHITPPEQLTDIRPVRDLSGGNNHANRVGSNKAQLPKKMLSTPNKRLLFQFDCPLRCVGVLDASDGGEGPRTAPDWRIRLAVGSNMKSIHALSYRRADLFPTSGAEGEGEDLFESSLTQVQREADLEGVHKGSVYAIDWNAPLRLLASGSNDKSVRLSRPDKCTLGLSLKGHNGTVRAVKFSSSSRDSSYNPAHLASAGAGDCKPRFWDVQTGTCVQTLTAHPEAVHGLDWLNPFILVSGCDHGILNMHDTRNSSQAWSFDLNSAVTSAPNYSKGSKKLGICSIAMLSTSVVGDGAALAVVGSTGGYVSLVNVMNGSVYYHEKLHKDDVRSISVPRAEDHSHRILTSSYDGTVTLWNAINLDNLQHVQLEEKAIMNGHSDKVLSTTIVPYRNQPELLDIITSGADGKVILWSLF